MAVNRPEAGPPPRLRTAYWYWHRPFQFDDRELQALQAAEVDRLYVLAGTVVRRGERLKLIARQQWQVTSPVPIHAVFRVHSGAIDLLLATGGAKQAADLVREAALPRAVEGVQWDADVPTARLADYREFLTRLRPILQPSTALGLTALPDWLRSRDYAGLCGAADEITPQFYGNRLPRDGREPPALWEAEDLLAQVRRSVAGRARVWAGLPAYGRCLVMDDRGGFAGERHDLQPESLLADPAWEVRQAATRDAVPQERQPGFAVEDSLLLWNRESAWSGSLEFPPGTSLWFQWPRIEGLRAAVRSLASARIPGVEGVCLFRWPAPEEPLGLAPVALKAATRAFRASEPAALQIRLSREGERVRVRVHNPHPDPPRLGPSIRLEVAPGDGEVEATAPATWYLGEAPASPLRADRVRFDVPLVRPGVDWEPCSILRPRSPVTARLSWTSPAGPQLTVVRLAPVTRAAHSEGPAGD